MTRATARAVVAALAVCGLGASAAIAGTSNPVGVWTRGFDQAGCGVAKTHCGYAHVENTSETDPALRPLWRNHRHPSGQRWGRQGVEAFGQPDHPQRQWKRSFG